MIIVHAKVVFGTGAGGKVQFVVDENHIEEFIKFVYHQLKDFNFSEKQMNKFLTPDTINSLNFVLIASLWKGAKLISYAKEGYDSAMLWFRDAIFPLTHDSEISKAIENLADNILKNPEQLSYLTPAAKGRLLYQLSCYFPCFTFKVAKSSPSKAMIKILQLIQSAAELLLVFENIIDPKPSCLGNTISAAAGQKILLENIQGGMLEAPLEVEKELIAKMKGELFWHKSIYQACVYTMHNRSPLDSEEKYSSGRLYVLDMLFLMGESCRDIALKKQKINKLSIDLRGLEKLHQTGDLLLKKWLEPRSYSHYYSNFMQVGSME